MSEYKEKFLEAEKQASNLVKQLEKLKDETTGYKNASGSLDEISEKMKFLIDEFSSVILEEKNLIKTLKEIGTEKIFDELEKNKKIVDEKLIAQNILLSKMFKFVYIIIGLSGILGVLIFIFK